MFPEMGGRTCERIAFRVRAGPTTSCRDPESTFIMATIPTLTFVARSVPQGGTTVLTVATGPAFGDIGSTLDQASGGTLTRAAGVARFTGKRFATVDVVAPAGLDRAILLGLGTPGDVSETDWVRLGGIAMGKLLDSGAETATIVLELPGGGVTADIAADFALGLKLRAYEFDLYKSKKPDDEGRKLTSISLAIGNPSAADTAFQARSAIANGVILARDLVNEPANVLGPVEFAARAAALESLGVEVEILEETAMAKLGMRALLGVAQGSVRPPRLVILRWNGGGDSQPVAFVGKGVVFDTGGISIKPAAGMEDMKGDMGGAAAVTGLIAALAGRKAKVNAIGVLGLVENMPDGNAQRPGDIVRSMAGVTIEVINTDAEGRLVLCDALHYTIERFKPKFVVDLATLTGAIVVALGHHMTGMYATDDQIAVDLDKAGKATGELVWRMPLAPEYDKLIEAKFADIKNTGGRDAGSITAAQFLKRFVGDTPWVHLDIAGTAMGSPQTDINKSWGSGWGVRILDRFVADFHEV